MTVRRLLFVLVVAVAAFVAGLAGAFLRALVVCEDCR